MKFLVTRPEPHNVELVTALTQQGISASGWPSLWITAPSDWQQAEHAMQHIRADHALIFVSQHAVAQLTQAYDLSKLYEHPCFAIGKTTAEALQKQGFQHVIYPDERADSEHLAVCIQQKIGTNKTVWIFRGQTGRNYLGDTLSRQGMTVHYVTAYHRLCNTHFPDELHQRYDLIICTSLDGLKALHAAWNPDKTTLTNQAITVASDTMLSWAQTHGFTICHQLPSLTNPAIVTWCQDWINSRHETL